MNPTQLSKRDNQLLEIVDSAFEDSTRRSGRWLACRPGCHQCCVGAFTINQLDVARLRRGLAELAQIQPKQAARIQQRAKRYVQRQTNNFPGNPKTGILGTTTEAQEQFEDFANNEPCPALNRKSGTCELYAFRPMTCRLFGPPVRSGDENGLGVCELCYHGASAEEIQDCEMKLDIYESESKLNDQAETQTGIKGKTVVAWCLAQSLEK